MKPRIYRGWDARKGRFVWTCSDPPAGWMGLGISQQARYDWNRVYSLD